MVCLTSLQSLPTITVALLSLPRLGNLYLSEASFSILADLLSIPVDDPTNNVHSQLEDILKAVLSSAPSKTDAALIPSWSHLLGTAMVAYHDASPDSCASTVGESWKAMWSYLDVAEASTRKAIAEGLGMLVKCLTPSLIEAALKERSKAEPKSTLGKIVSQTDKALGVLAYARAVPEVLSVLSSLILGLRYRSSSTGATAAELLLLPTIVKVSELRVQKSFEFKEAADQTLSMAMRVLGPEVVLRELPLNIEPTDR